MDLHVLRPTCGIGIHRHRDNQEIFLMMEGQGLMVVGDWNKFSTRDRCFEARTMRSGDMALCKSGQLHALLNLTDTDVKLFMFGGYD
jgi:quercetin dioxygenase-like cupin family protein